MHGRMVVITVTHESSCDLACCPVLESCTILGHAGSINMGWGIHNMGWGIRNMGWGIHNMDGAYIISQGSEVWNQRVSKTG